MKPQFLIVDGHSMIHAWSDLLDLHSRRKELAREELIRRLALHQDASGQQVVLVFDGQGKKNESRRDESGIQVIYSKSGHTADSVIERLAANYAAQYDLTVATNDHMEQQTVSSFGASSIDSRTLRLQMESAQRDLSERIRRHNRRR